MYILVLFQQVTQTWQFYFSSSLGVDRFSLIGPCQKLKKTVKGSIVKLYDCLIIARDFLDQSEANA